MSGEAQLMERLRRGEEDAWLEVFPCLWGIARRAAGTAMANLADPDKEDIAMETVSRVVQVAKKVDSLSHLKGLVATIAFPKTISLVRLRSATKRTPPASGEGDSVTELAEGMAQALSEGELQELLVLLSRALGELDLETRSYLWDKHVLGLSYQELGTKYGRPTGTIAARIARGIVKVRSVLEESPGLMKELSAFLR